MRTLLRVMICVVLAGIVGPAMAQTNTDTYFFTPGGGGVNGAVGMCLNGTNPATARAVPCSDPSALPSTLTGFDSGPITAFATPANSSHAAGTSIGGLFQLPLARIAGGSGILTQTALKSTGGSTGQVVARIWAKNPANTTCNDNQAFAGSDVDDAFLITPPFSLTPAAPAVTTGDAATYAAQTGMTVDYKNLDTVPSQKMYVCLVTVATDTADQNHLVRVLLSGVQN